MGEWWAELETLNQWFYAAAAFFSVFLVYELIAAVIGLSGGDDMDTDTDADVDADVDADADVDVDHDVTHDGTSESTLAAFKLFSMRSIVAFCTLFSWAGALYMSQGERTEMALMYGLVSGFIGMFAVAGLMHLMLRLTSTGTQRIGTAVGRRGTVYLDIPENGPGQVRVLVSGAVSYVKARAVGGQALKAGTPIEVVRALSRTEVEVEPTDEASEAGEQIV
jgi:membrane protein implicated in regulation of membrane protease activity